jgi:hypothetical protein
MITNKQTWLVLIIVLLSHGLVAQVRPCHNPFIGQTSTTQVVIGEEPVSSQPEERKAREAKSARYNGGGCDLTLPEQECFFESFAPASVPWIPLNESTFALLGTATKVQPYLSADRTHIYTETRIQIEEVFKSPKGFKLPSDQTLIVDRFGGSMTTFAGLVIRDGSRIDFMGQTYVGGRYVFFLRQVHEGKDLSILTAYELRDGKVFRLTRDGSPGKVLLSKTPKKADSLSDEQEFLQAVRQ